MLQPEFRELRASSDVAVDIDLADALTFVRLLALLRERFYESAGRHCRDGKMTHGFLANDFRCACPPGP